MDGPDQIAAVSPGALGALPAPPDARASSAASAASAAGTLFVAVQAPVCTRNVWKKGVSSMLVHLEISPRKGRPVFAEDNSLKGCFSYPEVELQLTASKL